MASLATVIFFVCLNFIVVAGDVYVLDGNNKTRYDYPSESARFGPELPNKGLWGHLIVAVPVNACSEVQKVEPSEMLLVALVKRGTCTFAKKVFNVQQAGYNAAIIYNVGSNALVSMSGDGETKSIHIPSVFVGETSGLALAMLSLNVTIVLTGDRGGTDRSIFLIPFAVIFPLCALIMCCFFCIRCCMDHLRKRKRRLSKSNLKKLPIRKFKKGDKFEMCAVCLEEYEDGDKLRELPCAHAYHQKCIDPWLTKTKQTCPLCNKKVFPADDDSDAENGNEENRSNENTPLLTSRGNPMSDYGISVASRNNVQRSDSDSDNESLDDSLPNHIVSRAEVHSSPRIGPSLSRGNPPEQHPREAVDLSAHGVASDVLEAGATAATMRSNKEGVVTRNDVGLINPGFDLNEDYFEVDAVRTSAKSPVVSIVTNPLKVRVHEPNQPNEPRGNNGDRV